MVLLVLLHLLTPGLACSPQRCTITAGNQTQVVHWLVVEEQKDA